MRGAVAAKYKHLFKWSFFIERSKMSEFTSTLHRSRKKLQKVRNDTDNFTNVPQELSSKGDELRDGVGACHHCTCGHYRGSIGPYAICVCGHYYDHHGSIIKDSENGRCVE